MEIKKVQINKQNISSQIVDYIVSELSEGNLKPGDKMPSERDLTEVFGASRVPIREAIKALNMTGILESRQGEGTFICSYDSKTLGEMVYIQTCLADISEREIFETRVIMESQCASLAALNADETDIASMKQAIEDHKVALGALGDIVDEKEEKLIYECDSRFHKAVAIATHNRYFQIYMDALTYPVRIQHKVGYHNPEVYRVAFEAHSRILEAILNKDSAAAFDSMKTHIEKVRYYWDEAHK